MSTLRLAFYGDDFTGSTDAMEALTLAGLKTVLFLHLPTSADLAEFDSLEAIGVAGNSRAMTPKQMDQHLAPALEALTELGPPIIHYKVCSTFDSSPQIGSIGHTIELGRRICGSPFVPVLAAAPVLGRYSAFGTLFARSGLDSPVYRLDRHPTMSRHPVTPMNEADLPAHLAKQTDLPCRLFDVSDLESDDPRARFAQRTSELNGVLFLDLLADRHLPLIGQLLSLASLQFAPLFVVGSSGVEYALCSHWLQSVPSMQRSERPPVPPVDQMLIVSGSCSPVSDRQMAWALENGYQEIQLDPRVLLDVSSTAMEQTANQALNLLAQGASVLIDTCRGPGDPRLQLGRACLNAFSAPEDYGGHRIGDQLAILLQRILNQRRVPRIVVVGGDTSAYVGSRLGVRYLEYVAPIEPGGPLCRAVGTGSAHGASIIFKGGQVGSIDYLGKAQGRC